MATQRALITLLFVATTLLLPSFSTGTHNKLIQTAHTQSYPRRPWLGVVVRPTKNANLSITQVQRNSPAQRSGLRVGDIILTIDKALSTTPGVLQKTLATKSPGDTLTLSILRNHTTKKMVVVTLKQLPGQTKRITQQWMGQRLRDLELEQVHKFGTTKRLRLSSLKGAPIILEFFATWCTGCTPVKDVLTRLKKQHRDHIHIISISNEPLKVLSTYIQQHPKIPYIIARDKKDRAHSALFVDTYPVILLLDNNLRLRKVFSGLEHPDDLHAAIKSLHTMQKKNAL